MRFQGDIASIPIADVAQNLSANRKSGILVLHLSEHTRWIIFEDGKIISYTDDDGFSIPRWFEEKQIIPQDAFQKVMRRYKRARRKGLGKILEDAGELALEDYIAHLHGLFRDMLCETFTFREGTFEFLENAQDADVVNREITDANVELPVGEVLMEAARRMDDWEALRRSLPSENDIYRIHPSERVRLFEKFEGDEVAQSAVELLDGTRSIREVIAQIPAGRFEACYAIAQLVSQNKARPVDGTELVAQLDQTHSPEQRSRALVRLKAALEREPGNEVLLQKLAELCLNEGKIEESAVYHKLLAHQLLAGNDVEGAEQELRRSLELNRKDISTWQKLYDLLETRAEPQEVRAFGFSLAKNLRGMGFEELARDHLARMLQSFPAATRLRFEYADTLFSLGDRTGAVEHLLDLAREQLQKGDNAKAEKTLAKVIEYDNHHKRAREIFEQIRSGEFERQRERRRLIARSALAAILTAALCAFIGYDYHVRREFALTLRDVLAEGLIERGEYEKAAHRLEAVQNRHPLSLLQFLEARESLEGLRERAALSDFSNGDPEHEQP